MLKGLLVIGHLFGLALLNLFLVDVSVVQNIPENMEAGKEYQIELKIKKDDLSGFAQIKILLPDGLTAEAANQNGSSFTFKDQTARFVWMSLPADPEITLNYTIKVDPDATGDKTITGKFSYLEDNNPASYIMAESTVKIGEATANNNNNNNNGNNGNNAGIDVDYSRNVVDNGDGTFLVKCTVNKGDLTGFARLKEDIPEGFTVEKGATQSAIFQNVDGIAKFIWTEVPAEKTFEVTYTLTAGPDVSGDHTLSGEFSYLVNDETQEAVSDPTTITVQGGTANNNNNNNNNAAANLSCDRKVEDLGDDRFKVVLQIDKGDIKGFARMKDVIPAGFTATEGETLGSRFSFKDGDVKFVWTALPEFTSFSVDYYLEPNNAISGDFNINGEFSYLVGDETKKTACGPTPFTVQPPATADNDTMNNNNNNNNNNVPDPQVGISYKVQICAGKKSVSNTARHFEKHYGYKEGRIDIENHEGWIKYTVGGWNAYKGARDKREDLVAAGYELPGPFVTAYNDGARITVQEALMLSGQQWVK